jgi:hypothetical protein
MRPSKKKKRKRRLSEYENVNQIKQTSCFRDEICVLFNFMVSGNKVHSAYLALYIGKNNQGSSLHHVFDFETALSITTYCIIYIYTYIVYTLYSLGRFREFGYKNNLHID